MDQLNVATHTVTLIISHHDEHLAIFNADIPKSLHSRCYYSEYLTLRDRVRAVRRPNTSTTTSPLVISPLRPSTAVLPPHPTELRNRVPKTSIRNSTSIAQTTTMIHQLATKYGDPRSNYNAVAGWNGHHINNSIEFEATLALEMIQHLTLAVPTANGRCELISGSCHEIKI